MIVANFFIEILLVFFPGIFLTRLLYSKEKINVIKLFTLSVFFGPLCFAYMALILNIIFGMKFSVLNLYIAYIFFNLLLLTYIKKRKIKIFNIDYKISKNHLLLLIAALAVITYIRIYPQINSAFDDLAFWGPTGHFGCYVSEVFRLETLPRYDPNYKTYSTVYEPVRFIYMPLMIVLQVVVMKMSYLSFFHVAKTFLYFLGIFSFFPMYLLAEKLLKNRYLAILAGLLVNIYPYFIVWSGIPRYDVYVVFVPLFFYFLLEGFEKKKTIFFIASGFVYSFALHSHLHEFWVISAAFTAFSIFAIPYFLLKRKRMEIIRILIVFATCFLLYSPYLLTRPVIQTYAQAGWMENSTRNWKEYTEFLGSITFPLSIISIPFVFWRFRKNAITLILILSWIFSLWYGVESVRIGEKYVLPVIDKITQEKYNSLSRFVFAPLTSSRLLSPFAQPLALSLAILFEAIYLFGKKFFKKFNWKVIFTVLVIVFILYTVPEVIKTAGPYITPSTSSQRLEAFRWMEKNIDPESRVLTDIFSGLTLNQRSCLSSANYLMFAKFPNVVYDRLFTYVYFSKDVAPTLWILKQYNVSYVYIDYELIGHLESLSRSVPRLAPEIFITGEDRIQVAKFEDNFNCFRKVYDNGNSRVYEANFSCMNLDESEKIPKCVRQLRLNGYPNISPKENRTEISFHLVYIDEINNSECAIVPEARLRIFKDSNIIFDSILTSEDGNYKINLDRTIKGTLVFSITDLYFLGTTIEYSTF